MTHSRPLSTSRTVPCIALLLLTAATVPAAWAQGVQVGTVTYAPLAAAQAVPTLSQWSLAALALALAALARHLLRHRGNGVVRTLVPTLFACAALLHMPWVGQAIALSLSEVVLDNPAGGVADIPDHPDLETSFMDYLHMYEVRNTTDRPQQIRGISVTSIHRILGPNDESKCTVGQMLEPMATCYLRVGRLH